MELRSGNLHIAQIGEKKMKTMEDRSCLTLTTLFALQVCCCCQVWVIVTSGRTCYKLTNLSVAR